MPMYTFESRDGEQRDVYLPIEEAPKYGARRRIDGKWFKRIVESPPMVQMPNYACKSWSAPFWDPRAKKHDPKTGQVIFDTKRDVDEYVRATQDTNQPMGHNR